MERFFISLILLFLFSNSYSQWEVKNVNESEYSTINVIKFTENGLGFAMGTNGLILKSTDLGESWQRTMNSIDGFISDFTFLSTDTLLCTSYDFDGQNFTRKIWRSDDGGISWSATLIDEGDFGCIQSISSMAVIASGSDRILKSADGGNSWEVVYDLLDEGFQFGDIRRFDMVNDSVGYAVGGGVEVINDDFPGFILKTTNGGNDWQVLYDSKSWLYEIDFIDEQVGYISDGYYTYKTENGGTEWDTLLNLFGVVDFTTPSPSIVMTVNRPEAYIPEALSTEFAISISKDEGETWSGQYMNGAHLESIFFINDSLGFVAGDYSIIMKTENCGGEITGDYPWHLFVNSSKEVEVSNLEIYPNPTSDFISIKSNTFVGGHYKIYSHDSGIVKQGRLLTDRIDLIDLPSGMYVLVAEDRNSKAIGKIVKK